MNNSAEVLTTQPKRYLSKGKKVVIETYTQAVRQRDGSLQEVEHVTVWSVTGGTGPADRAVVS
jgi:hypothetical protein